MCNGNFRPFDFERQFCICLSKPYQYFIVQFIWSTCTLSHQQALFFVFIQGFACVHINVIGFANDCAGKKTICMRRFASRNHVNLCVVYFYSNFILITDRHLFRTRCCPSVKILVLSLLSCFHARTNPFFIDRSRSNGENPIIDTPTSLFWPVPLSTLRFSLSRMVSTVTPTLVRMALTMTMPRKTKTTTR